MANFFVVTDLVKVIPVFSRLIGAMGLFTQAGLDTFQIIVFPFHLFCQRCLGILIQLYGCARTIDIVLVVVR